MPVRSSMLQKMGVTSLYSFVPVLPSQPLYGQPLLAEDLPALTAVRPIIASDDDRSAVTLVKLMLEYKVNLTVIGSTRPEDTLRLCDELPVSLVISDVMKPGMNGFEMLAQLRAQPQTRHLPFIFLTARGDQRSYERGMALGADRYLPKPILSLDIVAEVSALLMERYRKIIAS